MEEDKYLLDLPYWEDLTPDEKKGIRENYTIREIEADNIVYDNGTSCLGMIHVVSGCLRVYIVSDEGREITLYRLSKGDNCIMSASCVISQIKFDTMIKTETDTKVIIINIGYYQKLSENNIYVKCKMLELAAERFSQVMWVMQQILFKKFDKRLSEYLVNLSAETKSLNIYKTQEEIAVDVNSAREVVARMLSQFVSDGILENKRGKITIIDIEKLKRICD